MNRSDDRGELIAESMQHEAARIRFLERNRGREAALAFARQTYLIYRRAVVRRSAPAGEAIFRLRLVASYCYLKRYLVLPPGGHGSGASKGGLRADRGLIGQQ